MSTELRNSNWRSEGAARLGDAFPLEIGIATETMEFPDPCWGTCIDALLAARSFVAEGKGDWDCPPSIDAIDAALTWMSELRKNHPGTPPTLVGPEPAGGIVLDCETIDRRGKEVLVQLTFRNNGYAEWTNYYDRKVVEMFEIPFRLPRID